MTPSHSLLHRALSYVLVVSFVLALFPVPVSAQTSGSVTRIEDSAPGITTTGTWTQITAADASGGTVRQASAANATLSLSFTGPWLHLGLRGDTGTGIVEVQINGVSRGTIDTYRRSAEVTSHLFSGLGSGTHTLTLRVTGNRNPFSGGTAIQLDFVDVWDGLPLAEGTFDQSHTRVHRSSNWVSQANALATAGTFLRDGSNAWFLFTGTSVSLDAIADSGGGTIQIFLNGVSQGFFSLSAPTLTPRTFSFANLSNTAHVLQVRAYRGRAMLDGFRTPGVAPFHTPTTTGVLRYEEDDPALRYDGQPYATTATHWHLYSGSGMSRGHGIWTGRVGSTVEVTIPGPWVHLGFAVAPNGALVEVRINGVSRGTVDTYGRYHGLTSVAYTDLGPGPHTLTLTVLSRPAGTLGGTTLHLDYVDVWTGSAMPVGVREHDHPAVFTSPTGTVLNLTAASGGSYLRDVSSVWVPF